jgi:hypothetical protein
MKTTQPAQESTRLNRSSAVPDTPGGGAVGGKAARGRWLLLLLKLTVSTGLMFWLLGDANLGEAFGAMRSAEPWLVLLAASLHLVGFTLAAYRWRLLLRAQGHDASIRFLIESYVVGMFFNNFLPSTIGGDASRAYDVWRLHRSKSNAVAVVLMDRFFGLLALMLFAVIALPFARELTAGIPALHLWVGLSGAVMVAIVGMVFVPSPRMLGLIDALRFPLRARIGRMVQGFLAFQGRRGALFKALGLSLLLQANVVLYYFLIAEALELSVPLHIFFLVIPLVTVLLLLPISINAIGVREGAFVFFLAFYGVTKVEAVAFAWIAYALVLFQGLIGGVVYAVRRAPADGASQVT